MRHKLEREQHTNIKISGGKTTSIPVVGASADVIANTTPSDLSADATSEDIAKTLGIDLKSPPTLAHKHPRRGPSRGWHFSGI